VKSSLAEVLDRRDRLQAVLRREGYLSVTELSSRFGVSEATIRRDLNVLQDAKRVTRTFGGALTEFDTGFMTFSQRSSQNWDAKQRIGKAAIALIEDGQTIFLDAGSTIYAVAEAMVEAGLRTTTVVTNSLPVAQVLAAQGLAGLHLLGGCLLPHQLVVVGPGASLSLSSWRFDLALMSAEGMTGAGLWNSETEIADFQRHVCGRSNATAFCLDASKMGREAPSYLLPWNAVDWVVSDVTQDSVQELGEEASRVQWVLG